MKLLAIVLLVTAPLSAQSAAELVLTLKRSALVERGFVRLSDIAEIEGNAEAGNVLLGRAPQAGTARSIDRAYIRQRLLQSGFDADKTAIYGWQKPLVMGQGREWQEQDSAGDYEPENQTRKPAPAAVREANEPQGRAATQGTAGNPTPEQPEPADAPRPAQPIIPDVINGITKLLTEQFHNHEGTLYVTEESQSRSLQRLPAGAVLTGITPRHRTASLGRLDYELTADVNGREVRGLTLTVRAELEIQRAVAGSPAGRGEVVTPVLRTIRTASISEPGWRTIEEAIGLEATRQLNAGDVLTPQNTHPAIIIRRGDNVRVTAHLSGGGQVTIMAEAAEHGAKGQVIRLRRKVEGSREPLNLLARATAPGEAMAE